MNDPGTPEKREKILRAANELIPLGSLVHDQNGGEIFMVMSPWRVVDQTKQAMRFSDHGTHVLAVAIWVLKTNMVFQRIYGWNIWGVAERLIIREAEA